MTNLKTALTYTDHGEIKPTVNERKPKPYIPFPLCNLKVIDVNGDHAALVGKYGLWAMRALRDLTYYGKIIQAQETFKATGNYAWLFVTDHAAEFLGYEKKAQEQAELLEKAKKLNLPSGSVKDLAEFQHPTK